MSHLHPLEPRRHFAATLSVSNPTVSESAKFATFQVTLPAPSPNPVTLAYATQPRTAAAGRDFKPTTGRLTLPAGQTSATIKIPLVNDDRIESTETFRLNLSTVGAKLSKPFATATITDDEILPVFSISSATVTEGTGGPKARRTATLTVTLANLLGPRKLPPSDVPFTVRYETSDLAGHFGAAAPKADFAPARGTLTFRPGETKKTIQIPILPDSLAEGAESFTVTLSRPTGGTLPLTGGAGTVTITDDDTAPADALPTLHVPLAETTPSSVAAILSLSGTSPTAGSITVSLSAPTDHDVTFDYTLPAPGTTSPEVTPAAGTVTIPAGQTEATVPYTVNPDTTKLLATGPYESPLTLCLSNLAGATLPGSAPSLAYTLLVRYEHQPVTFGNLDVNLDGVVNSADYVLLDRSFAKYGTDWTAGDFNYDGQITAADYRLADAAFGLQPRTLSPEFLAQREALFGNGNIAPTGQSTGSWYGQTTDSTTILTHVVYTGDLNLDSRVNADDYALINRGAFKSAAWSDGDFNYDGSVDDADFLLIDRASAQSGTLSPELLAQRETEFGPDYVAQLLAAVNSTPTQT